MLNQYDVPFARSIRGGFSARRGRIEKRLSSSPSLAEPLHRLNYDSSETWAWNNYRATTLGLALSCRRRAGGRVRLLEIGGGRNPMFSPEEAAEAEIAVTVNDIDAGELSRGPKEFGKALFDICGEIEPQWRAAFDIVVSHMVMEHVRDARRAWRNMARLLAPSGVAMAFHPTLYAPPFVINRVFPDRLTAPILKLLFPKRHQGEQPKFPARYELCRSDLRTIEPMLKACGFREALIAPFWGHGYFRAIPGLREIDAALQRLAEARDWRVLTTYAYTLARR